MKQLKPFLLVFLFLAPTFARATAAGSDKPITIDAVQPSNQPSLEGFQAALDGFAANYNDGNSSKESLRQVRQQMALLKSKGVEFRFDPLLSQNDEDLAASLIKYGAKKTLVASKSPHVLPLAVAACILAMTYVCFVAPSSQSNDPSSAWMSLGAPSSTR